MMDLEQKYLNNLNITADCQTLNLIEITKKLFDLLNDNTKYTHEKCNQLLYTATTLHTILEILTDRGVNLFSHLQETKNAIPNSEEILENPFKWCATRLCTVTNGEQFFSNILQTDETFFNGKYLKDIIKNAIAIFAKNSLYRSMAKDNQEFCTKTESYGLLEQLQHLSSKQQLTNAIDNLLWFRSSNFTIEHLMHILLTNSKHKFNEISCYIYNRLVTLLTTERDYFQMFWTKITCACDTDRFIKLFLKCCQLNMFYNCLTKNIIDYLNGLEKMYNPVNDDFDYVSNDFNIEFRDVRKLICIILLHNNGPVQKKLSKLISESIDNASLKIDLLQFLIYSF